MGLPPSEVDRLSLWEFFVCVEAWQKAHGSNKPEAPSEAEFEDAIARLL